MDDKALVELCHQVMRDNPAATLMVRCYPTGFLQLMDALRKLAPDEPYERRKEHLYRLCIPGFWAADKSAQAMKDNPQVTGPELADILRQAIPEECEYQQNFGECVVCGDDMVMDGLDVDEWALKRNRQFEQLIQKLKPEHRHEDGEPCLACEVEKTLQPWKYGDD